MIGRRLLRLVRGDFSVFEEIASDSGATIEAAAISSVASAIATYTTNRTSGALALGAVAGVVGLAGWTSVLWATGRALGGEAGITELFRAVGYTAPPFVLSGIPLVGVAAVIGSVALQVVAVRRLHRLSTGRSLVSVVAPWIALFLFGVALQALQ